MKTIAIRPYNMTLFITTSTKEYVKKYEELDGNHKEHPDYLGVCANFGGTLLVGVFEGGLQTLVHELSHVVFKVAKFANLHVVDDEEVFCYLIDDLFAECVRVLPELKTQI